MNVIRLGQFARDKSSGFTGIVTSRTDFLTGNVQYALQPPAKDGALPETVAFDAHQLEEIPGPTVARIEPPSDDAIGFKLGEKVKDIVTGFEGVATRKATFLNGCVYFSVQGKYDEKEGRTVEDFTEYRRLERSGAGVTAKLAKKVDPVAKPSGGPNTRGVMRRG